MWPTRLRKSPQKSAESLNPSKSRVCMHKMDSCFRAKRLGVLMPDSVAQSEGLGNENCGLSSWSRRTRIGRVPIESLRAKTKLPSPGGCPRAGKRDFFQAADVSPARFELCLAGRGLARDRFAFTRNFQGIVSQVGGEPFFNLFDSHAFSLRIVLDLVAGHRADCKVAAFRMREIEAGN